MKSRCGFIRNGDFFILKIEFAKPIIGSEEKKSVLECLDSPQLVHGPRSVEFEKNFAAFVNGGFATSTSSATTALQLAYLTLGIGIGDEVIVPSLTHIATANAVMAVGAKPIFVDVNLDDGNISVSEIIKAISENTKAICVVHFLGLPVDMEHIVRIAKEHNLFIVEDCALALGAKFGDTHVGLIGDFGAFSFYPAKHITTGEGGMLISKNNAFIEKAKKIKAFYYDKNVGERNIPGLYDILDFGLNLRMSEMAASLGIVQLKKLNEFLEARKANSLLLHELIGETKFGNLIKTNKYLSTSANYCSSFILKSKYTNMRNFIIKKLRDQGVGTSIYYPVALPLSTFYSKEKFKSQIVSFKNSKKIADSSIAFPIGPHLSREDIKDYAQILLKILKGLD